MCTVSFIPVKGKYYITSNRDEKLARKPAIPPAVYYCNDSKLIFPKDADAGGSWIAINANGNAAVLLNGAFIKHIPAAAYKKSRGLVFLEIIEQAMPVKYFLNMDLGNIEAFTLVLFTDNNLYECRWDGNKKYCRQLKTHRAYIWSSATLYSPDTIKKREYWFAKFLNREPHPSQEAILRFHQFTGDGDRANDLLMSRGDEYSTVSLTSIALTAEQGVMQYIDLKEQKQYQKSLDILSLYELA